MWKRVTMAIVVALLRGCDGVGTDDAPAGWRQPAQQPATAPSHPDTGPGDTGGTRPATTTFMGDTGLWFVPTGEVLPAKRWSFSVYRVNFDYTEGFTDVSNLPVTFGVGLGDRAELFGALDAVRRIDRDCAPDLLQRRRAAALSTSIRSSRRAGPATSSATSGSAASSTSRRSATEAGGVRLRGMMKLPTAKDDEEGVGTGKIGLRVRRHLSKEINERVELSGFGGLIFRGSPDEVEIFERVPLGLRRRAADAQEPASHRGTPRRGVLRRHGQLTAATALVGRRIGSLPPLSRASTRRSTPPSA